MPPVSYDPRDKRYWPTFSNDSYDWQLVFAMREIADELRAIRELLANPRQEVEVGDWFKGAL